MIFFGIGKKKKRHGKALLDELGGQVIALASALSAYQEMNAHLARKGEVLNEAGMDSLFLVFGEDVLKYGKSTRAAMADMSRNAIDLRELHEVEYLENQDDPRREAAQIIVECGELATTFRLHRGLNAPDYVTDFLERRMRPQIPDTIAKSAGAAFQRIRLLG